MIIITGGRIISDGRRRACCAAMLVNCKAAYPKWLTRCSITASIQMRRVALWRCLAALSP